MATELTLTFPWGRFHATPWLRSNNEGAVEWPPSPWRILRALYSSWQVHNSDLSSSLVEPLLSRLCESAPTFRLPPHTEAHTRHYLPGTDHRHGVKTSTDKTIDSFVAMPPGAAVTVSWPVDLDADQRDALARLATGIRYLGRAESIVDVAVTTSPSLPGVGWVSEPTPDDGVFTLVPDGPAALESMSLSPSEVRKQGRLMPPHVAVMTYTSPKPRARTLQPRPPEESVFTAVRLSLSSNVLPSRYESVTVGDVAHRAAIKLAAPKGHSPILTGKGPEGSPLEGNHQHVHYLPVPDLADLSGRRINSVVAWAPGGFTKADLQALADLGQLRSRQFKSELPLGVLLTDSGLIGDVAPELSAPSTHWASITPYAPARHYDGDLAGQVAQDISRELEFRGLPAPAEVQIEDGPWLQYRRYRPGRENIRSGRPAYGVLLRFDSPVAGPLALGQLSHFGLGLFHPVNP